MTRWMRGWIGVVALVWTIGLAAQSPAVAASAAEKQQPTSHYGAIAGRVRDRAGVPQAGIAVTILREDGRFVEKVYSQANGRFRLERLLPGVYAAAVAQPSFQPFWKSSLAVSAGAEFLLEINLLSLADSIEVGIPASLKDAAEQWKWVLRSSYPPRPILRLLPETRTASAARIRDPRQRALRGTLQFVAGNELHGFGQDPGLRTAFDVAYALEGSQSLALAGSAGWERNTPAASLRAAWNRRSGEQRSSTLSMTVRQLFLPGEYWVRDGDLSSADRRVQSITMGYEEEQVIGDRIRLQLGSLYDTLHFGRQMTRWSPFGRLTISPGPHTRLTIAFTAANPRVLPDDGTAQHQDVNQWLAVPQLSGAGDQRSMLEGGRHTEVQWEQRWGWHLRAQAAAFYDVLSETALSLALDDPDSVPAGLLRDPFSDRYFVSGGDASAPGARVALGASLSPQSELIVGYGYAATLETDSGDLVVEDAETLRNLLRVRREHSLTVKMNSLVPMSHTRVIASYRWLPRHAVAVSDPYDHGFSRSEPFLNLYVLQPLPSPGILPGQFEAVADFNNLLAQGYLSIRTPQGATGTLFPAPRSFRGGFNFIF